MFCSRTILQFLFALPQCFLLYKSSPSSVLPANVSGGRSHPCYSCIASFSPKLQAALPCQLCAGHLFVPYNPSNSTWLEQNSQCLPAALFFPSGSLLSLVAQLFPPFHPVLIPPCLLSGSAQGRREAVIIRLQPHVFFCLFFYLPLP